MPVRSALFVDYDNAVTLHPKEPLSNRVANLMSWLEDGRFDPQGRKREFLIKSAYWHPRYEHAAPAFQHAGFLTRSCIYIAGSKQDSSAVDLHLVIDVIDAVSRMKRIEEVVILATDSDYFPLVATLRARDIRTAIVVSPRDASKVYEAEADIAIPAAALGDAYVYVRPPRRRSFFGLGGRSAPAPAPAVAKPAAPAAAPAAASGSVAPSSDDFATVAERFATVVSAKRTPLRAQQAVALLKSIAPNMKTSGENAFFGKATLLALLTEIASLTGRIKVFWMGPGQLAVRGTRSA